MLSIALDSKLLDVHTCMPGIVVSYDETKKRADVRPAVKRALPADDDKITHEALPVIPNVPVGWISAGGFELHFPLTTGDTGWLIFSEVATSAWEATGQVENAGDVERHGLSSPLFIPCRRTASTAQGANLVAPSPFVVGAVASAQFVALANLVKDRLDSIQSKFDSHTHLHNPGPGAPTPTTAPNSPIGTLASVAATRLKSQ